MKRACIYARFSSDNQRTESIDAQIRAIREYCVNNKITVVKIYADKAISGTSTDNREEFLKMIKDSKSDLFDYVIVHKLDRFARNRYDQAIFEKKLNDNNVKIISVLEQFNDSPESVILKSVLTGMSEYFSLNLSREVKKGKNENFENFRCIISLRSEIFGLLNSSEINKVRSDYTIELSWDQQKLISALKLRLGKQDMNNQKFKKWLFKQKYKEINQNRVDIYRYLFYKTRFRPRDIFMFVKEIATISTKIPISIETIDLASGKYSNYFKNEMVNELHGFIPDEDIKTFIVELSEFQKTVFRIEDFKKYSSLTPKNILKIFQFLYDSDFVNLKVVQNSHRTKMIPCSQSSTTNTIKLSSEIAINYGLRDALNLYNN